MPTKTPDPDFFFIARDGSLRWFSRSTESESDPTYGYITLGFGTFYRIAHLWPSRPDQLLLYSSLGRYIGRWTPGYFHDTFVIGLVAPLTFDD